MVWVLSGIAIALTIIVIGIIRSPTFRGISESVKRDEWETDLVEKLHGSAQFVRQGKPDGKNGETDAIKKYMGITQQQLNRIKAAVDTDREVYGVFLDKYEDTINLVHTKLTAAKKQRQLKDQKLHTLLQDILSHLVDDVKRIEKKELDGITHDLVVEAEVLRKMREGTVWEDDVTSEATHQK